MANYSVDNFISTPTQYDVVIKIYDKNKNLKYTINPKIAFFVAKANILIIKMEDKNDINLDFPTTKDALSAIGKLNVAKKSIVPQNDTHVDTSGTSLFSTKNLNMIALSTVNDGDQACSIPILDIPVLLSVVRVQINGLDVNVGGKVHPYDCYFSSDNGAIAKVIGDERLGDKLYWNGSIAGYNLDTNDLVDFIYLKK